MSWSSIQLSYSYATGSSLVVVVVMCLTIQSIRKYRCKQGENEGGGERDERVQHTGASFWKIIRSNGDPGLLWKVTNYIFIRFNLNSDKGNSPTW